MYYLPEKGRRGFISVRGYYLPEKGGGRGFISVKVYYLPEKGEEGIYFC